MINDFSPAVVEQRVQASIRPQIDKADVLLDHYLEDAPVEVWLPIADRFNPDIGVIEIDILPDMSEWNRVMSELGATLQPEFHTGLW